MWGGLWSNVPHHTQHSPLPFPQIRRRRGRVPYDSPIELGRSAGLNAGSATDNGHPRPSIFLLGGPYWHIHLPAAAGQALMITLSAGASSSSSSPRRIGRFEVISSSGSSSLLLETRLLHHPRRAARCLLCWRGFGLRVACCLGLGLGHAKHLRHRLWLGLRLLRC